MNKLTWAALTFIIASGVSQAALADPKDEFKKGCEEGHGSYGEDVHGVFCNSSGGVHIACDEKITKCTASMKFNPIVDGIRSHMLTELTSRKD